MPTRSPEPQPSVTVPALAPSMGQTVCSKRRILIAEDSEATRLHLRHLLESDPGICVDTVANGSEALEALTERPYSMLVTDLKMPHISGMELLEEVQKRRLPVAVIVTTGYGSIDE